MTVPHFDLQALTPLKRGKRYLPAQFKLPGIWIICLIIGFGIGFYVALQGFNEESNIPAPVILDSTHIHVCFSPQGNCEQEIVRILKTAKHDIHIQIFTLTSKVITQALLDAQHRGVAISIIYDPSQYRRCPQQLDQLRQAGIQIYAYTPRSVGLAHNKVIIIDDHTVITGSYNFTYAAANRNAENVVTIQDKRIAQLYIDNWHRQQGIS